MWTYDPGPVELFDPRRLPRVGELAPAFESLVAPSSEQLRAGEQRIATKHGEIVGAGVPNVDADTEAAIAPAVEETAYQHETAPALTLSEAAAATGITLQEVGRVAADLPVEDSEFGPPDIPGEGTDELNPSTSEGEIIAPVEPPPPPVE